MTLDKRDGVVRREDGSDVGGKGGGNVGQKVGNKIELVLVAFVVGVVVAVETVCTSCLMALGSSRKIRIRRKGSRPFCVSDSHCLGRARISLTLP